MRGRTERVLAEQVAHAAVAQELDVARPLLPRLGEGAQRARADADPGAAALGRGRGSGGSVTSKRSISGSRASHWRTGTS